MLLKSKGEMGTQRHALISPILKPKLVKPQCGPTLNRHRLAVYMCIYIYVCVYVYIYIHTYTHIYHVYLQDQARAQAFSREALLSRG